MIRNVKRELKEPNSESFKMVATGMMGSMRRKTVIVIFWTSEVAFKISRSYKALFFYLYTILRPGGMDFRKALVNKINTLDVIRNIILKLIIKPV